MTYLELVRMGHLKARALREDLHKYRNLYKDMCGTAALHLSEKEEAYRKIRKLEARLGDQ